MRLIKIGRSASNHITINSDAVSSIHAEITILNSGDILLEDKNSRNGTYIMNRRIEPGKQVPIKRGDAIRFANVELQWSQIPIEDNSSYQAIYGIGSNFRNEIQLEGNTVSRYHATLKIDRKKNVFIQDHSKNGTTVNGMRVRSGENVKIKRDDVVLCGSVKVDLRRYVPASVHKKMFVAAAIAACIVALAYWGFSKDPTQTDKSRLLCLIDQISGNDVASLDALQSATVCVSGKFYVVVTIDDDPFVKAFQSWPTKWVFGAQQTSSGVKFPVWQESDKENVAPVSYTGTAFFISTKGDLGTNRHIAMPWLYLDNLNDGAEDKIRQLMMEIRNAIIPVNEIKTTNDVGLLAQSNIGKMLIKAVQDGTITLSQLEAYISRFKSSPITISGEHTFMGIAFPGQNYESNSELMRCHVVAESGDAKLDVALLRTNSHKTPDEIVKNGFFDINQAQTDYSKIKPQEEELLTIGYPNGFQLGFNLFDSKELQPTIHKLTVSKKPDDKVFQFQGEELQGASGSPIVDKKNRKLLGVLFGKYAQGSNIGLACNIKHLKSLYDNNKIPDDKN